ncbi:MAG: thiamine phosphate synthase [Bacteroidaceae bacterium]|nr:thiamine phosphate synthase [Bacteroidaceae bacterium]
MKLIVVTSPEFFVEEDKIITALFEEGLDVLHLRKPKSPSVFIERLLTLIPEKYHQRIVTHEHFYLKEEFKLMGIHLNDRNKIIPEDYEGHISCYCQSIDEVKKKKHFYDYILLNPVFDCISKPDSHPIVTDKDLMQAKKDKIITSKVVAFGGIRAENIQKVKDYGFDSVAVMGDLWDKFDEHSDNNFKTLVDYFIKLRKLAE